METDFGMLPYPKYDENQDSYNTNLMTQRIQGISVPTTNTDPERTGIILEALAYHSDIVRTAYYDITLTGKYARDEESIAILDTIFESRCYDIGKAFDWGGIAKLIQNSTLNNGGFVSSIEAALPSAQTAMEKTYADYMSATK